MQVTIRALTSGLLDWSPPFLRNASGEKCIAERTMRLPVKSLCTIPRRSM